MAPSWDRLDRLAGRAVNSQWGEACRFSPMVRSEFTSAQADPARAAVTVLGIFTLEPKEDGVDLRGQRLRGEFSGVSRVDLPGPRLKIMAEEAAKIGFRPRQGDQVILTERAGRPTYTIADVTDDDVGDLLMYLTQ
jgi:hypothetical protein